MCLVTYFQHRGCNHTWATVTEPCGPWMGFSTCRSFGEGATKERPSFYRTWTRRCPRCAENAGVAYDRNTVRVVERMGWGLKLGTGPDEDDWGVDRFIHQRFIHQPFMQPRHHVLRLYKASAQAETTGATTSRPHAMLPTPDTSHVPYERVYEPSEDSFLLLDTLSADAERQFLRAGPSRAAPLVVEIGSGSGVVLGFVHAHAHALFGSAHVLTAGVDVNAFACRATVGTVARAQADHAATTAHAVFLGACLGDLASPWRRNSIDVLIFNPPYVPTPEMPSRPDGFDDDSSPARLSSFDRDSYLLALSYAGGRDGMETTDRLINALPHILAPHGCAYILLCAQNRPEQVKQRIQGFGSEWRALTVGSSGKTAGWERLQVVRIWRETTPQDEPQNQARVGHGESCIQKPS